MNPGTETAVYVQGDFLWRFHQQKWGCCDIDGDIKLMWIWKDGMNMIDSIIYPLVNSHMTMERSTVLLIEKIAISMAISNNYVKLPEGKGSY